MNLCKKYIMQYPAGRADDAYLEHIKDICSRDSKTEFVAVVVFFYF